LSRYSSELHLIPLPPLTTSRHPSDTAATTNSRHPSAREAWYHLFFGGKAVEVDRLELRDFDTCGTQSSTDRLSSSSGCRLSVYQRESLSAELITNEVEVSSSLALRP